MFEVPTKCLINQYRLFGWSKTACELYNMCAGPPVMTEQVMGLVDELYEMRLESLLSVQDLVEAVVEALEV